MTSKKQCPVTLDSAKPVLELMPLPHSSRDLAMFLQYAACLGLANTKMVAHLTEMSDLFPQEMMEAYRIVRARQAADN
jgi:hypothetical protein